MKLIFTKTVENEISVQLQNGTVLENFSYTTMVKKLLQYNAFEDNVYNNLTEEEIEKVEKMLEKINNVFEEDSSSEETEEDSLL